MAVMSEERLWGMQERWIKHYSSAHDILLVGDGDFSFSLCLARAFGSARKIVATSLDSYDELIKKYKNAKSNLAILRKMGAFLLHGVDATKSWTTFPGLEWRRFHRIIFNFPHAGFFGREDDPMLIELHRNLVHGFFWNASQMLWPGGEVHVSHKTTTPYTSWNIEGLALRNSLYLIESVDFKIKDYPGYQNKRGSDMGSDVPFRLGACRTFKFTLQQPQFHDPFAIYNYDQLLSSGPYLPPISPPPPPPPPPPAMWLPFPPHDITEQCRKVFGGYLDHLEGTFGITTSSDDDVYNYVSEALRVGYESYMTEVPGKSLSGYIDILEELRRLSRLRLEWLGNMLSLVNLQL